MNDYRPVALTTVAMKDFEHILLRYLKSSTAGLLDPHQFAYQTNRSADDTVALGLRYVMKHLEQPSTYARILFVDFSLSFNTIIPVKLFDKLVSLNVHPAICHWTLNFLLHRPQSVKVNNSLSPNLLFLTLVPHKAACFLLSLSLSLQTTVYLVTNLTKAHAHASGWYESVTSHHTFHPTQHVHQHNKLPQLVQQLNIIH